MDINAHKHTKVMLVQSQNKAKLLHIIKIQNYFIDFH